MHFFFQKRQNYYYGEVSSTRNNPKTSYHNLTYYVRIKFKKIISITDLIMHNGFTVYAVYN